MYAKLIIICLLCWFCIFSTTPAVQADGGTLVLTKEKAIELALENHGNIKLLEAKINALQSQINYIENENDELKNVELPNATALPTDIEFFIEQYPDFNELEDEEKWAVEQIITTQILINTSLNQLLEGQTAARNQELQEKIKLQREELNRAAIVADIDKNKNQIDLERTTEVIKYYISQKYITLLLLEAEIEQLKMEQSYIEKDIQDFDVLIEHGLINGKDLEKKNNELQKADQRLNEKERIYQFYMEELKSEIGLPYNQTLSFEKIDIVVDKLPIKDLESHISKMFNVRTLEENIRLNQENYNMNTESDKTSLKDYYYYNLQATKYEKEVLIKEMVAKVKQLELEQETLFKQVENLKKSKEDLLINKKDLELQFSVGFITSIEKDKINQDIQRIESQIEICNYQYYLLNEKFNRALNGYLP